MRLGLGLVDPGGGDVVDGHHHLDLIVGPCPVDGGGLAVGALLHLVQGVAVDGDRGLHLPAVGRLLVELDAGLELDNHILEGGDRREHVLVTLLGQIDHRRDGVAHLPGHQTNPCEQTLRVIISLVFLSRRT